MSIVSKWSSYAPQFRSLLRIVAAAAFLLHGTTKLMMFPAPVMPGMGAMAVTSLPGFAGALEIVGGALLLIGLFTRPVAFLLSGEMAVAYFMSHFPKSFWPSMNGGELAVLYCFLWLYFSAAGAGVLECGRRTRKSIAELAGRAFWRRGIISA